MLELSHISKCFDRNLILDDISLSIDTGDFFGILGPSGSGKTSLLNVIAGLLKQDSGTVVINGVDVSDVPPNRRNIGMVFQNFFVYPHLNVYENIRYPLRYAAVESRKDIPTSIRKVAELLDIAHLLNRKSYELSGGEKQRVALARAIIKSPALFLLDEPLSSIDYKLRLKIRSELKNLHRRIKKTFIYVTHDQTEAFSIADRIAIMSGGGIIQVGTPAEVHKRPNSLLVAEFVHSYYNEFPVTVSSEEEEFYLLAPTIHLMRIPVRNSTTKLQLTRDSNQVTAFIKCQDIHLTDSASPPDTDSFTMDTRIIDIIYLSDSRLFILEDGLKMTTLSSNHRVGDRVSVRMGLSDILLYDQNGLVGAIG